jgi:hypothetical protein
MDLKTALTVLDCEIISLQSDLPLRVAISYGAAADLMSDVLAYARPGSVLLTGLVYPQVVRTAEMAGMVAIILVRGKHPAADTVRLAEEIGIPLFTTRYTMYEACGRLYAAGLGGYGFCDAYDMAVAGDLASERA